MSRRAGGWAGAILALFLTVQPLHGLAAQHFSVGPQLIFADYREVSADLHYRGTGIGAGGSFTWKKLSADVRFSQVKYKPTDDGIATADFDATEIDVQLRYFIAGPVSAQLGFVSRKADPEFEAQSVGGATLGARMAYLLGPGVHMSLDGGLIVGTKFSGGGSASALGAFRLGLGLAVDAARGRVRITGDYDFQRISRTTGEGSEEVDVPIQQSLGRVGVAIAF
jgi:hypothetical protein